MAQASQNSNSTKRPQEQPEPQDLFSPGTHQLGEMYQLGSPEAMYRTNVLVWIVFLLIWNLLIIWLAIMFFDGVFDLFFHPYMRTSTAIIISMIMFSFSAIFFFIVLSFGIFALISVVINQNTRLYVYRRGLLLYRRRNSPIQAVSWEHISHIRYSVTRGKGYTNHRYSIICRNGQSLIVGDEYIHVEELRERINLVLVHERLPDLLHRYQRGESLSFGPYLSVNRDGIRLSAEHGSSYSWYEIDKVEVSNDSVRLFLSGRSKPIVHTLTVIDNLCLLQALLERVRGQ